MRPNNQGLRRNAPRLLGAVCLLVLLTACGLTAPRASEGYADLKSLGMRDTDQVMSLSIGPSVLRFAASHVDDDPEVRELLRSLDGIRIRIYEIDGDAGRVALRVNAMSSHLQEDGWEPVMLVRQENEATHMLLRVVDDRICGLTVLVSDGDSEAVVINLMGKIKPEQFGDVMLALEVDAPGVGDVELAVSEEG
ncbi:DUF4252 domain-containing protein [Pseudomonadota bacterium]|jgi:hypothetical protein